MTHCWLKKLPGTILVFLTILAVFIGLLPTDRSIPSWSPNRKENVRQFNISAISVPIVYNKAGDHDPNGMMYVLKEQEEKVKRAVAQNPLTPVDLVQPLVIRANVGDFIIVDFENKLDRRASIHIQGVQYNVQNSDGAAIGFNKDTTTGGKTRYYWYAQREGVFLFHDMADPRSSENSMSIHGLFGALVVEPAGASWKDPVTGEDLLSGCQADIHVPGAPDFREYVTVFHDEPEMKDKNGQNPVSLETGEPESTMPINYRAEPMRNRHPGHTGGVGEEVSMSSWPFGDPATPIVRAYVGDPAKFHVIHAGVKETHVFHLHNHQWRLEQSDPKSTLIDSISFSPQQAVTIEPLYGAGSLNGAIGDVIWHCHLYPHFGEGMWGLWRILDRLEDGTRKLPDGTLQPALQPLPDRAPPLRPDKTNPGFPNFIAGIPGLKAFKPPLGIIGKEFRQPTALEKANFVPNAVPGMLYSTIAPPDAPLKVFEVVAIQVPIVYNSQNWHDPEGRVFVLKEDKQAVLSGKKKPEPFVIRANAGDLIEIRLTNELPSHIGGNEFQLKTETTEVGWHIHLVKFDAITADGGANGWANDASAIPGDTLVERFYADTELRTVFFHDHLFANVHQQHGLFGALIIEPEGSKYLDPKTGKEIKSGTQAIIHRPGLPDFREYVLAVHDFALLFDKDGKPLNPPPVPGSPDDPGVMGINYKSEPLQFRKGDPAYAFSSYVHGDPVTPLLEAYEDDPIRIRVFDGAHEEQHAFNMNGIRWRKEPTDPVSPVVGSQTIGISEAFNIEVAEKYSKGDYLYHFGSADDIWLGLWGIFRVHGERVPHLIPLPDKQEPPCRIEPLPAKTGKPPAKAKDPGNPGPNDKIIRKYDVVAIQKNIIYNAFGDHDPQGMLLVPKELEEKVLKGEIEPEPLILRANAGDLIEVTLTNHLSKPITQDFHPGVPVDTCYPASNRVSMHAQLLQYDVLGSDGATVGYNPDQTVGPGESITYRWYADQELGAGLISSYGDTRNHRQHGLFGAILIEPAHSIYLDNASGKVNANMYSASAIISPPGEPEFREFVLFMQNGLSLYDKHGVKIPDPVNEGHGKEPGENHPDTHDQHTSPVLSGSVSGSKITHRPSSSAGKCNCKDKSMWHCSPACTSCQCTDHEENLSDLDYEDQGMKGFNYRSERFANRLKYNSDIHKLMNSLIHGDPATPVFQAYTGDRVKIRLIMPGDKPRNHSFLVHGHSWRQQPDDPFSEIISSQGAISIGNVYNIELDGGISRFAGDYAYRSGAFRWDVESGMWGILRVYDKPIKGLAPLVQQNILKFLNQHRE